MAKYIPPVQSKIGQLIDVTVTQANPNSLRGEAVVA